MLCYVTPLEAVRKEKERITRLQGTEIWRRQKEENRAKMIKEKREVRDLLENYWPWGRPGGGAPNSDSVGLRNIHLEELYANEDMKKAKRFAGVFQFGRPGGGAPHFSKNGRRQIGFKEDPALRFQWGADLRRTVDNTLRYRSRRDEQERYKKDLDAMVEEKKRTRDQQLKQNLDFKRQMGWTHDKTVYQVAENKLGKENQCHNHSENSDRSLGRNKKFYPLLHKGSGVELVPLIVKRRTPAVKVALGTTDVTRGDTLFNRTAVCEPKYFKDLNQQVQQKHQRLKYSQNEDAEKCEEHFHAWSNFWGRPGNGAPKSSTKKGRLMHMLYPQGQVTSVH